VTKPWYNSTTNRSAIAAYAILLANLGVALWQPESKVFRYPTQAEVATVIGGAVALKETMAGRARAVEPIGKKSELVNTIAISGVYEHNSGVIVEPNFNAIADLPSAEYVSVTPDSPPVDELESIDNDEDDTLDVDFSKLTGKYYLVAQVDTKLKTSTAQTSELASVDYREVGQWQRIDIDFWSFLPEKNEHIEVRIDEYNNINGGKFYAYAPHFRLFNALDKEIEIEVPTSPIPIVKKDRGKAFKLPGNSSTFYTKDPIYPGSHFLWSEATKDGTRIPENATIVANIIKQAKELDKLRSHLGVPLMVTSFYRDRRSNAAVGGATGSSHLTGLATDIYTPAMSAETLQAKVLNYWKAGGIGKGAAKGFVHVSSDGWLRVFGY
jgi:Peptidase M15